ncbi:ATP-dependent DNA ligase [Isoptericola hypogeus]|uniref:DNA ligase (ATP) n=1 Tax=Isoptericola hypogeus TaxID=300179 RepID=A0ABP4VV76_9MICO
MLTGDDEDTQVVRVGNHDVRLTHLSKVLYPETGTTKRDVVEYYAAVADAMLPHVRDRPATRKRWPDGVGADPFFHKDLGRGTPDWVVRRSLEHRTGTSTYPLVQDAATLVWLAQMAALEIHVPQWRFARPAGKDGSPRDPDRLVLDLDPGEGAGLPECVEVARLARAILRDTGLEPVPVTSGSKGIHLYARLDGRASAEQVTEVAHELARALEADHGDLVVSDMKKTLRRGKVLVDWSQNNGSKTTVAPYSLRGRSWPWVAVPRTWRELGSPHLRQLDLKEVLSRIGRRPDPLAGAGAGRVKAGGGDRGAEAGDDADGDRVRRRRDALSTYREKRDRARTDEPVPDSAPEPRPDGSSFVIQEHHASRLHWDFRLERDGVLVSWALPKGEPDDPARNHLAVQTEDHPLEYGGFAGTIAKGEYGAGTVTIWDAGSYDLEKWHDDEVVVVLHGSEHGDRRLALIRTKEGEGAGEHGAPGSQWLIHRTKSQDGVGARSAAAPTGGGASSAEVASGRRTYEAMLTTLGQRDDVVGGGDPGSWAFEMKWDGIRTLARVEEQEGRSAVALRSRNQKDQGPGYPEIVDGLGRAVRGEAVLDGEIVALDEQGRPSFARLQQRMNLADPRGIGAAAKRVPVQVFLFDVLEQDGEPLLDLPYTDRRERLEALVTENDAVKVPPAFDGDFDAAWESSERLGLEGVLAKRRDSPYAAGRRTRSWIKIKHARTQEVVVVGWRPGNGRRAGTVGSLLLGVGDDDGRLRYAGRVGTGFSDRDLDDLRDRLGRDARKTSPLDDVPRADARDARWVTPRLVGEVEFAEWTDDGRLRQPRWRGWREDKAPSQVRRE